MTNANDSVRNYLDYYLGLSRPRFAVMIRGPWGCGKTHLVDKIMQQRRKDRSQYGEKFLYVSLYGVKTVEEIDAALLEAMVPALSWQGTKVAGKLAKAVLRMAKFELDFAPSEITDKSDLTTYIFDDLERSGMSSPVVLGYINEFVEHHGSKVLLLANESEIDSAENSYRLQRENLIGQTLEVSPEFSAAYHAFVKEVGDDALREFFGVHEADIESVFRQSLTLNLRSLRQSMLEFGRIYSACAERHLKSKEAMRELALTVMALSMEVRAGKILDGNLINRRQARIASYIKGSKEPESNFVLAAKRYVDVGLDSDILSDQVFSDILFRGFVKPIDIQKALDESSAFATEEGEAEWRTVWHIADRDESVFRRALKQLESRFRSKLYTVTGEVLHVFALRLSLSERGILTKKTDTIFDECKRYVDALYRRGELEPLSLDYWRDEFEFESYGNLGFSNPESKEFRQLQRYLHEKRDLARRDTYPDLARVLVEDMSKDVRAFARKIARVEGGENTYCRVPLLLCLSADKFSKGLLNLPADQMRLAMMALGERYKRTPDGALISEDSWIRAVRDKLRAAAKRMTKVRAYQVNTYVKWYLDPALG